jgi:hypothetical protein
MQQPEDKIPRFRCQMETITATHNRTRVVCQAYGLTVQRKGAVKLSQVIHSALARSSSSDFLFLHYRQ